MRYLLALIITLCAVSAGIAQEKLPPRFEPLTKNDRFQLLRVLGMPELRPSFSPTSAISADGKWGLYTEDLSTESLKKLRLKTRLLLFDLQAKGWPREFEIDGKTVTALALSHDGGKAVLAAQYVGALRKEKDAGHELLSCLILLDLKAGKAIRTIDWDGRKRKNEHGDALIFTVALSPDERTMLAGSRDRLEQVASTDGKVGAIYEAQNFGLVTAAAFLPGGKQFLAGSGDGRAWLFDVGTPKPARTYPTAKAGFISHLAVSSDGKRFAVGLTGVGVSVADVSSGKEIGNLPAESPADFVAGLAFADARTVIAACSKAEPASEAVPPSRLLAFDVDAKKMVWSKSTSLRGMIPMLIQGENVLVGGGPNLFETWSTQDGKKLDSWGGHKSPVNALAVLPNDDILSAGQESMVMTWRDGKIARKQPIDGGPISVIAMSKNRKQWLSAGADTIIQLHTDGADKPIQLSKAHTGPITSLAFSVGGSWAVSGSGDRTAVTWDLAGRKVMASFAGHSEGVNTVAVSPDDKWLATGSDDTTIRIWPIKAGKLDLDREAITLEGHKKPVTCLAFSPDGKTLISGSQDQTLKVWDWAKEKVIRTIPGHKNWITSLLLVDAKSALTTSDDLTLRWWNLDSGKELGKLDFGVIGDCPRCLARLGPDRLLVGTSSWLIYELQMLPAGKSGQGAASSK